MSDSTFSSLELAWFRGGPSVISVTNLVSASDVCESYELFTMTCENVCDGCSSFLSVGSEVILVDDLPYCSVACVERALPGPSITTHPKTFFSITASLPYVTSGACHCGCGFSITECVEF